MSVILNASSEQLREFRSNLEAAGGTSKRMAGDIRKSIGNRLKELRSALIEVGFKFIEAFVGKGEGALDRLIVAVRNFDITPIVNAIKRVIEIFRVAYDGIKIFGSALGGLGSVFKFAIKHLDTLIFTFGLLKVAVWAVNTALYANPIGIVIGAIVALIAVVKILAENWNSASATIQLAMFRARDLILSAFEAIRKGAIHMINAVISAFNAIPGVDIPQLKVPDDSAKIERQVELLRLRNKLLIGAVKDSEELQRKALGVGASLRGQQRAAAARQIQLPGVSTEELAPFEAPRSVDPELVRQQIGFQGEINLRGAPEGSTFTGKTRGAPPIRTEVLGANP
jgi:hypothetical protein